MEWAGCCSSAPRRARRSCASPRREGSNCRQTHRRHRSRGRWVDAPRHANALPRASDPCEPLGPDRHGEPEDCAQAGETNSALGSIVEYRCEVCAFSSGELRLGWGKAGRASFWGGLVRCDACRQLSVAHITTARDSANRDSHCAKCRGLLTRLEGTSVGIPCPRCRQTLRHKTIGTWN